MERHEGLIPVGLNQPEGKTYFFLKLKGGKDAIGWGTPPDLEKIKGQECVLDVEPAKEEGKAPTLKRLVLQATGEVIFEDKGKASGSGGGARGSGSRASDPAERASIEAQSALSHSLQEVRMASILLQSIASAAAPYDAAMATAEGMLGFVLQHLDPTTERIRALRRSEMGVLAGVLAATRSANMGASSGSGSQSKGAGRTKASTDEPAPGGRPPGSEQAPSSRAVESEPGPEPDLSAAKAKALNAAIGAFRTKTLLKAAHLDLFGEAMDPPAMPVLNLEVLAAFGDADRVRSAYLEVMGEPLEGPITADEAKVLLGHAQAAA